MSETPTLDSVVAAYLQAVDRGESPDRGELLRRHPELAADLAAVFTDLDRFGQRTEQVSMLEALARDPALEARDVVDERFGDYVLEAELARSFSTSRLISAEGGAG